MLHQTEQEGQSQRYFLGMEHVLLSGHNSLLPCWVDSDLFQRLFAWVSLIGGHKVGWNITVTTATDITSLLILVCPSLPIPAPPFFTRTTHPIPTPTYQHWGFSWFYWHVAMAVATKHAAFLEHKYKQCSGPLETLKTRWQFKCPRNKKS